MPCDVISDGDAPARPFCQETFTLLFVFVYCLKSLISTRHTPLTHSYLLNEEQPPTCEHCKCLLTVEHILTKYTVYKQVREKYYQRSQLSHIFINAPKQYIFIL